MRDLTASIYILSSYMYMFVVIPCIIWMLMLNQQTENHLVIYTYHMYTGGDMNYLQPRSIRDVLNKGKYMYCVNVSVLVCDVVTGNRYGLLMVLMRGLCVCGVCVVILKLYLITVVMHLIMCILRVYHVLLCVFSLWGKVHIHSYCVICVFRLG